MNLMAKKWWFFLLSTLIILPGIWGLISFGLNLGIDFTGGTIVEYKLEKPTNIDEIKNTISSAGIEVNSLITDSNNSYILRTKPLQKDQLNKLQTSLGEKYGQVNVERVESVGPIIGGETTRNAILAIVLASFMIVFYLAISFRKVPKPASPWRFGITAVLALVHDVIVVLGIFAILGHYLKVEVDVLFVTAILTVIGFSVHDTIVVFDRIRENLPKHLSRKFSDVANISIVQTLARSLSTSLTVIIVLLALLLFGGVTIKWFVVALLIGIISGTYSSIFNATALLALWEERLGH